MPLSRRGIIPEPPFTGQFAPLAARGGGGVSDGTRTHDIRSHNPVLYQLSYAHLWRAWQDSNLLPPV